jgi:hypothetical protein
MKALWKLCLVVVVGVGGLAGQEVVLPPEGTKVEWIEVNLEESGWGLYWRPDTAGYPITLSTNFINSEGEAWRIADGGGYKIIRADGTFTFLDTNGVLRLSGTWFMIENFQITDHPYQIQTKPSYVSIMCYNFQYDDGKMGTRRSYFVPNDANFDFYVGVWPKNAYFRAKAPTE